MRPLISEIARFLPAVLVAAALLAPPPACGAEPNATGVEPPAAEAEQPPAADEPKLRTGKVIPRVVTRHDPRQSYALYLPKAYTPDTKWPILYGFSPAARGTDPVQLYAAAAEKYGWIVVGSNNSQNGPHEPIEEAITALLKDTEARLSIDPERRYSTGFSGGARVGLYLAARDGFAGSLPIGAGLATYQKEPEAGKMTVFAMCGLEDFNHAELLRLSDKLASAKVRMRLTTFNGGHQWAPPELCATGVRYMELVSLASRQPPPAERMAELVREEIDDAVKLLDAPTQVLRAHDRLVELAELCASEQAAAKAKEVEAGEAYKREREVLDKLSAIKAEVEAIADGAKRTSESIERYAAFAREHPGTAAGERVTAMLRSAAMQLAMGAAQLMQAKRYAEAEPLLQGVLKIVPNDPTTAYNLACVLARNGKKQEAMDMLVKSVKLGFTNFDHIRNDPDLESLRDEPAFIELVAQSAAGGAE